MIIHKKTSIDAKVGEKRAHRIKTQWNEPTIYDKAVVIRNLKKLCLPNGINILLRNNASIMSDAVSGISKSVIKKIKAVPPRFG